jgi:hypothetical protein
MIRQPAVANQFYTGDPVRLRAELAGYVSPSSEQQRVIGIIAPHAGYVYSGATAGAAYGSVEIPDTMIILGPNHHGIGARAAIYPAGSWNTPLGIVPINARLAEILKRNTPLLEEDSTAHLHEHSIEVHLPFLQYLKPHFSIVPICLGFGDIESCRILGEGMAGSITEYCDPVLIVASSDMNHYEAADVSRHKDELALERVLALDPEGLLSVCQGKRITMCGVVPAATMLFAAKALGATAAQLVRYSNSGDVSGDYRQVVGYAAVTVS